MDQRQRELSGLRERITRGQYEVDARAVAEAIVRRAWGAMPADGGRQPAADAAGDAQSACSYPDSSSSPTNVTAGDPSETEPTQVRGAALSQRRLSASAKSWALRGIQAHSS